MDVSHESRALLVARRDVADGILAAERLEDVHRLLARDGEDVLTLLDREAFDEEGSGRSTGRVGHYGRVYSPRRGRQFGAVGMIVLSVARDSRVPRP